MELADVVAKVESGGNQFAQRFERLHLGATNQGTIARIMVAHDRKISAGTADVYAAMSHGLFQIMGFELWGPLIAYDRPLWQFMNSADDQKMILGKFLALDHMGELTADSLQDQSTRE